MPTSSFNYFDTFQEDLGLGYHDLNADTLKIYLSNTAPVVTNSIKADIAEIGAGNGYSAGGVDTTNTMSESSGTATIAAVNSSITASGGSIGPFQYCILYNDTQTSPADPLIGWWDYGSALTLNDGDQLNINHTGGNIGTISHA